MDRPIVWAPLVTIHLQATNIIVPTHISFFPSQAKARRLGRGDYNIYDDVKVASERNEECVSYVCSTLYKCLQKRKQMETFVVDVNLNKCTVHYGCTAPSNYCPIGEIYVRPINGFIQAVRLSSTALYISDYTHTSEHHRLFNGSYYKLRFRFQS